MKAVYIEGYGGLEQLKFGELPIPALGRRDVLVEVHAASINPVDWKIREGYLQKILTYRFPLILGWDVAGIVKKIGPQVTKFKIGDAVFSRPAIERNGTYAEYVAVDEALLAKKPTNQSFEEAAAVPLAGLTAWEALVEIGRLQPGQKALIHAGAGGVGTYGIQIAKACGAHVAATASGQNLELVRSLGADDAIDYTKEDFSSLLSDYDVVLDTIGGETQQKSYHVLRKDGIVVSIASQPDKATMEQLGVRGVNFFLEPDGQKLTKLANWIEEGKVRSIVGATFPLEDTAKAHALSESRHAKGKIIIKVR